MAAAGGGRVGLGGLDHGHEREERRGGARDRRGRRDRRDYERERERERLLEDEAVGPFASRFQSLEEMRGQVRLPSIAPPLRQPSVCHLEPSRRFCLCIGR